MKAKPKTTHGGFREGSGGKRRSTSPNAGDFTEAQEAWISAVVAASPIASAEVKRGGAEILATTLMRAKRLRALMATERDSSEDHARYGTAERSFWKGLEVLRVNDPPPPLDLDELLGGATSSTAIPQPATSQQPPSDPLMDEIRS